MLEASLNFVRSTNRKKAHEYPPPTGHLVHLMLECASHAKADANAMSLRGTRLAALQAGPATYVADGAF
jgi:hypothetical protein